MKLCRSAVGIWRGDWEKFQEMLNHRHYDGTDAPRCLVPPDLTPAVETYLKMVVGEPSQIPDFTNVMHLSRELVWTEYLRGHDPGEGWLWIFDSRGAGWAKGDLLPIFEAVWGMVDKWVWHNGGLQD